MQDLFPVALARGVRVRVPLALVGEAALLLATTTKVGELIIVAESIARVIEVGGHDCEKLLEAIDLLVDVG